MGRTLLRLEPAEDDGPSLAKDCARDRALPRIDDIYVEYFALPEVPVQRPGPPIRHEPPLPGEEDETP